MKFWIQNRRYSWTQPITSPGYLPRTATYSEHGQSHDKISLPWKDETASTIWQCIEKYLFVLFSSTWEMRSRCSNIQENPYRLDPLRPEYQIAGSRKNPPLFMPGPEHDWIVHPHPRGPSLYLYSIDFYHYYMFQISSPMLSFIHILPSLFYSYFIPSFRFLNYVFLFSIHTSMFFLGGGEIVGKTLHVFFCSF